jgi:hypothetical protein
LGNCPEYPGRVPTFTFTCIARPSRSCATVATSPGFFWRRNTSGAGDLPANVIESRRECSVVLSLAEDKRVTTQSQDSMPGWRNHPWLGGHLFPENRNKFPVEELLKYNRQYVAWLPDGSGIRASGPDMITVWKQIESSGDDPSLYCYEYITDETYV